MKIQTHSIQPYVAPALPALALNARALRMPVPAALPEALSRSPIFAADKVHVFSPGLASPWPSQGSWGEGVRSMTKLIAAHCGQKVATATNVVWLVVDSATVWHGLRDADGDKVQHAIEAGELTADALAVLGGLLGSPHLEHASATLHFAAVVGDHLHTGQLELSQSELAEFLLQPQSEEVANLLKLSEVFKPRA